MSTVTEGEAFRAGVLSAALVPPLVVTEQPPLRSMPVRPFAHVDGLIPAGPLARNRHFLAEFLTVVDPWRLHGAWVACECGSHAVRTAPGAVSSCPGCDRFYLGTERSVRVARWDS